MVSTTITDTLADHRRYFRRLSLILLQTIADTLANYRRHPSRASAMVAISEKTASLSNIMVTSRLGGAPCEFREFRRNLAKPLNHG